MGIFSIYQNGHFMHIKCSNDYVIGVAFRIILKDTKYEMLEV